MGAAYFTTAMLLEGTAGKSSQEIAHIMDYYGATISVRAQADVCSIVLSSLAKYMHPMLELFIELLLAPSFPQKSLNLLKDIKAQSIQMADQKPSRVAYKYFCEALFTRAHPYGGYLTLQDVRSIKVEDVQLYYETLWLMPSVAFVSGQVSEEALQCVAQALEQLRLGSGACSEQKLCGNAPKKIEAEGGNHMQSAIAIGKQLLCKNEVDFLPMVVVNELLGGYFGSRLMRNIREDKGYTYGIHSKIVALQQAGYWVITTEVAQEVTQSALQEIYKEITLLQQELVSEKELQQVQNYLLGRFIATINDPFAVMQKFPISISIWFGSKLL